MILIQLKLSTILKQVKEANDSENAEQVEALLKLLIDAVESSEEKTKEHTVLTPKSQV
jgi:hypothetical protein